ncbi:MAG: 4-(cytidine 5'-diphospho)-2-C-methyl-D-erythritol kinase [Bacteroidetes bacterium QS_8_64_10]|nr:MAG: 4-(cytidine 5'-diphospho)-2-C-methyl-D-erythritol kinase [Bacteroidetes bacterium QS_8_64_10]
MIQTRRAPAKINLGLHVLRRRPDGFHDLATVFQRIPWEDELAARPASDERIALTCSDPALPTDDDNLVVRAARLEKPLPAGAGLGGGSSDAAAALRLLSDFWSLDATDETLRKLAARLGSDVPFFLGAPAAYATGRGDVLHPMRDYRLPFPLVVAVPDVAVSTPDAYRLVAPSNQDRPDLRAVVRSNDPARWRRELTNDFEEPVVEAYPVIGAVRATLRESGAAYAALSGSGSAVFGVFEGNAAARTAARQLAERDDVRAARFFSPQSTLRAQGGANGS